jgi:hypothetical protein
MLGVLNGLFGADERGGAIGAMMQLVCMGECNGNVHTPADGRGDELPCRVCGGVLRYDLIRFVDLGRRSPFVTPEQLGAEVRSHAAMTSLLALAERLVTTVESEWGDLAASEYETISEARAMLGSAIREGEPCSN